MQNYTRNIENARDNFWTEL